MLKSTNSHMNDPLNTQKYRNPHRNPHQNPLCGARLLTIICALFLASCGSWLPDAHRIDVIQGNAIKKEALEKIHTGMKKSEITPILGSPLISDPFHVQRWDYIYRYIPGRGEPVQSRVTLYFEADILVKIDDSEYREPEPDVKTDKKDEELQINTPAAKTVNQTP